MMLVMVHIDIRHLKMKTQLRIKLRTTNLSEIDKKDILRHLGGMDMMT